MASSNGEISIDKTSWHSKLLTAGSKFGSEDRVTKKKSIKFGLQFSSCLHKVIRKAYRCAKITPPLKEVDKFFGNSLYKNEATLHDENVLDLLDRWFVASIVFYIKSKQGLNKLKYAFKQQVNLNKKKSNAFDGKNNKLTNIKTIFTLSKEEYGFFYRRLIKSFQLYLAKQMDPIPMSRSSSRPNSSYNNANNNSNSINVVKKKEESKNDEPPIAGELIVGEEVEKIDPSVQLNRNLIVFSEMTDVFLQNCVNTDWQNDRDEVLTISKIRIYSLLHEIIVYSIIGRKHVTPSRIKDTLNSLFDLAFPELQQSEHSNVIKTINQRKRERLKAIKTVQQYKSPYDEKEIKRHYPKPWNIKPIDTDELMRRRIEYAIRKGESLDKFKSAEIISAIGDKKQQQNKSWLNRRVADVKKNRKRGAYRLNSSIKRSGGVSAANTRSEYYQIRDPNATTELLLLPPPFRPPFSGQSSWTVAFGRSRPATSDIVGRNNTRRNRQRPISGSAVAGDKKKYGGTKEVRAVNHFFQSPYC